MPPFQEWQPTLLPGQFPAAPVARMPGPDPAGGPDQLIRQRFVWRGVTSRVTVPVTTTVPLAPGGLMPVSLVTVFADFSNTSPVSIGPQGLIVPSGGAPNITHVQLDAGMAVVYETDDYFHEFFDLGSLYAAQPNAGSGQLIHVTIFSYSALGG